MPAIAFLSELSAAACRSSWGAEPQGIEGREVLETTLALERHLREPVSSLPRDGDTTYRPVLFRKAFTVRVKCQLGGRLKPLTHPDEE